MLKNVGFLNYFTSGKKKNPNVYTIVPDNVHCLQFKIKAKIFKIVSDKENLIFKNLNLFLRISIF